MEFNDSLSIGMDDFSNNEEMEIPEVLPMMAVRDVVIFNYMIIPLFVGRPGSVEAVNEALGSNKLLMLVTQKDATKDNPEADDLYTGGHGLHGHAHPETAGRPAEGPGAGHVQGQDQGVYAGPSRLIR